MGLLHIYVGDFRGKDMYDISVQHMYRHENTVRHKLNSKVFAQ